MTNIESATPILPRWLDSALSPEEVARIEQTVKDAETRTSAEIVPMIVHRSTLKRTGDRILFWICFALFGVGGTLSLSLIVGLDEALLDRLLTAIGIWPSAQVHLILTILTEILVAIISVAAAWFSAKFLSNFDFMHRLVFPTEDLTSEAQNRAQTEFYAAHLQSTSGRTGVLLFVTMLEHRAVILADEAIVAKFDPDIWTKILNALLQAIGNGQMGKGYVAAIQSITALLEKEFPISDGDRNELPNRLRIIE